MIKATAIASALALTLSTAAIAQTTGPAGQQDQNKQGYANPNTPNMSTDNVVMVPAPVPDSTLEPATVGSAVSRPTEIVPGPGPTDRSIDGAASAPVAR